MESAGCFGNSSPRLERLRGALALLLEAYDDAGDVARDRWDFAVRAADLRQAGASDSALRWLRCGGWVAMGSELVVDGATQRRFRRHEGLIVTRTTCLVLTDQGAAEARAFLASPMAVHLAATGPRWDVEAQALYYAGQLIKRFRWQAPNQSLVLAVFEEEGWPPRIDDPLPPSPDQDPKRRLLDTIKCLNRGHEAPLLRFRGDGSGRGVRWGTLAPRLPRTQRAGPAPSA